jgi:hypothetical protein
VHQNSLLLPDVASPSAESYILNNLDEYQASGYGDGSHAHQDWYVIPYCYAAPAITLFCRNMGSDEVDDEDEGSDERELEEEEEEEEEEEDDQPRPSNRFIDDCAKEST